MGKKPGSSRVRSSTAACALNDFQPLSEDELLFLWKGLVDEGRLSTAKLITFMGTVAGVRLTTVQARDLLAYMDANGDGRVGMEDFKNFLSIGRLAETDPKSFMWEPKAKFQQENPPFQTSHDMASSGPQHDMFTYTNERRRSLHTPQTPGSERSDSKPVTPPETKAPPKKRPQPTRSPVAADVDSVPTYKPRKPPALSEEAHRKIEQSLLKYEQQSWEKFMKEEKTFKRHLFEQFVGAGEEEMEVTEYHKMLLKWFPLAAWGAPRGLRAADSLAALEYVRRRDLEERGISSVPASSQVKDGEEGSGDAAAAPTEAKMSYALWLDVVNGKFRPEEHLTDGRNLKHIE